MNDHARVECADWRGLAERDPVIAERLGICSLCMEWDRLSSTEAVDIPLMATNKSKNIVSPHFYRHMWVSLPYGTQITILHRQLVDVIGEDFDDDILIGEVFVQGGDRVHDLVSVIDRIQIPARMMYRKSWFSHPGSIRIDPCVMCGRFKGVGYGFPGYLYEPELSSRSPRIYRGSVLISPETFAKVDFSDNDRWKKLKVSKVPRVDGLLDPIPSPFPFTWEAFEAGFIAKGIEMPFHKMDYMSLKKFHHSMPWLEARIKLYGEDEVVIDRRIVPSNIEASTAGTMLFYLRMRALFEEKIAERIDGWDDKTLLRFLGEYKEATGGCVGYFPL